MNEKIRLSSLFFRIFFPTGALFVAFLMIILRSDIQWYIWPLGIITIIALVSVTYLVLRLRLIIDYENKKIIYYAYKKRTVNFNEIDRCYDTIEKRTDLDLSTTIYYYICLKKKDDSILKISINFIAFKQATIKNTRESIIQKINNIKL